MGGLVKEISNFYDAQNQIGGPVNRHYAEVLRLAQETEGAGEDVRLTVLSIPVGIKIRQ